MPARDGTRRRIELIDVTAGGDRGQPEALVGRAQLDLGARAPIDVEQDSGKPGRRTARVAGHHPAALLDPDPGPLGAAQPVLAVPHLAAAVHDLGQLKAGCGEVGRVQCRPELAVGERRIAMIHAAQAVVLAARHEPVARGGVLPEADPRAFDRKLQRLLDLTQQHLRDATLRAVGHVQDDAVHDGIAQEVGCLDMDPAPLAVATPDAVFVVKDLAARAARDLDQPGADAGLIIGIDDLPHRPAETLGARVPGDLGHRIGLVDDYAVRGHYRCHPRQAIDDGAMGAGVVGQRLEQIRAAVRQLQKRAAHAQRRGAPRQRAHHQRRVPQLQIDAVNPGGSVPGKGEGRTFEQRGQVALDVRQLDADRPATEVSSLDEVFGEGRARVAHRCADVVDFNDKYAVARSIQGRVGVGLLLQGKRADLRAHYDQCRRKPPGEVPANPLIASAV